MNLQNRYKYFPQMATYDKLLFRNVSFLMYFNHPNFLSDVVNTDSTGFRFAGAGGRQRLDKLPDSAKIDILTGGSTAFGVGATSDGTTIPSLLSEKTNRTWMNYAGRAFTSTQECISFMYHRPKSTRISNIVILGGFNDLYVYFVSNFFDKHMGSFFNAQRFFEVMAGMEDNRRGQYFIRPFVNLLLKKKYGKYEFNRVANNVAIQLLFNKKKISETALGYALGESITHHQSQPQEVIDVLRRNISNWKLIANGCGANIKYVLQPYADWLPNRRLTSNEKSSFDILDTVDVRGSEARLKFKSLYRWYSDELKTLFNEEKIDFLDSNTVIDTSKSNNRDVFVDRVHLTDYGYQILSDYIGESL